MNSNWKRARRGTKVFLCVLLVLAAGCGTDEKASGPTPRDTSGSSVDQRTAVDSGRVLARRHCSSCHKFPEPEMLNRTTWEEAVLPRMGNRLGIHDGLRPDSLFEEGIGGRLVRAANVFPAQPQLPRAEWDAIVDYYLAAAPEDPLPDTGTNATTGLPYFQFSASPFRRNPPMTTLLHVGAESGRIYVGDGNPSLSTLNILNRRLEEERAFAVDSAPSSVREKHGLLWATLIGSVPPTDNPSGSLVRINPTGGSEGEGSQQVLIDSLQRPVDAAYGDLNGDGREDIVISEFGYRTGALSWFEAGENGGYRKHVLRSGPGALKSVIRDFNEDGRPDIMALVGQGREAIYIFYNEGGGEFRRRRVLDFDPSFGSVYFHLADFNGDSAPDILYVNGDNADYTTIMKGYHGLRIFLNDGSNNFEEAYFYHLDGAYEAIPRDYDADGDLDIAAISFFPDYRQSMTGSFVFLEQTGDLSFEPSTFKEASIGAWLTLAATDLHGDGDTDLLLGSYATIGAGADYVPERLRNWWISKGPSIGILENTTQ